jgi:hypothetical protein
MAGMARRRLTFVLEPWPQEAGTVWSRLDGDVVDLRGIPVTSPLRTCFDLMRERALVEAVVVADAFAATGDVNLAILDCYARDRRRWPGIRRTRTAVSLATAGALSPGETRLRMTVVLAGFPEPLVNVPVVGGDGRHLGTPDLQVPGSRPVRLEYDGAYHEEHDQRARDRRRENRLLAAAAVPVLRYDRRHVTQLRHVVVREVAALTGHRPTSELDPRDFRRPPHRLAW